MGRPKEIKDGVRLSVVLSKEQAEYIKKVAIRMSSNEGRQISGSGAMRLAIEAVYPLPRNQLEMF